MQDERRDREIARHDDVGAACARGASGGERQVADPSSKRRPAYGRSLDRQSLARRQAVVLERIASWRLCVGPDDELNAVPAAREGVARFDRLDAVCPLEREPDIGEVKDPHEGQ